MASATLDEARAGARPLRDALYGDLVWSRPRFFRRELCLEAGSETLAILRWEKVLSFEAVGESADGRWLFARNRSLRERVEVRDPATQDTIATFSGTWRGTGTVRFAGGAEYAWTRTGFWRPTRFWSSSQKERLIAYTSQVGWRRRYEMEVDPDAHRVAELPVLVLLGAYLMSMGSQKQ